jgi:hypothetical protein
MGFKRSPVYLHAHTILDSFEFPHNQIGALPGVESFRNESGPVSTIEDLTIEPAPKPVLERL